MKDGLLNSRRRDVSRRLRSALGLLIGAAALYSTALVHAAPKPATPWWDDNLCWVDTDTDKAASDLGGTVAMCGVADDPGWGIFGQKLRMAEIGNRATRFHARGIKLLTYFEGFGETIEFVAALEKNPDGSWVQNPATGSSKILAHFWNWKSWDGAGDVRWIGAEGYFNDEEFVRPWTRTNPRYGAPIPTYPDGSPALGYLPRTEGLPGTSQTILNARLYDACAAKNVLGKVNFQFDVLPTDPATKQPIGRRTGLIVTDAPPPPGPPDPGYTPEQWRAMKRTGYAASFHVGKDCVCPIWADYAAAATKEAVDSGSDGLWIDNYSPWDSFGANPVSEAFGDWSVAKFRGYLASHFTPAQLRSFGVDDASTFDVREYLQAKCRAWGGDPSSLTDKEWRDPRWSDDPIWRAYIIYRRQTGTEALSRLYKAIKTAAAERGKADFLISGNDIPIFGLGWARNNLDMVSTETTWGWSLTGGPRGFMPPPLGSYVPLFKLAREYSKSRYVNMWNYGPSNKPGISDVMDYQALANEGSTKTALNHTICDKEAVASLNRFIQKIDPELRGRTAIEEAGLYYSSSSQLMEMLPGGFRDHADQPHSFAIYGWGAALTALHVPWRAVAEWHLNGDTLAKLKLLIIPDSQVFPAEDVVTLQNWIQHGGRLIVTGVSGRRLGESGNFDLAGGHGTLAPLLAGIDPATGGLATIGKGRVEYLPADPGEAYYRASADRPSLLPACADAIDKVTALDRSYTISAPGVAYTVGLTPYRLGGEVQIDINNTDIDMAADTIHPTAPIRFSVAVPGARLGDRLAAHVLTPDAPPACTVIVNENGRAEVALGPIMRYACVMIERAK